jgi:hypothetical protein
MFDTYQNGPAAPSGDCNEINDATGEPYDCIGIGVRVDNIVVAAVNLPQINGAFDDNEALTTNIDDEYTNSGVAPNFDLDLVHEGEGLTWATLEIEYSQSGNLYVAYKGREIFNEQIDYQPSPGQLVFGGRTGGANAFHHIDNIVLLTNADVGAGTLGDFDGDGMLTANDLDLLSAAVGSGNLSFDLNGDGSVTNADRAVWVEDLKNTYFGDSNLDGEFNSGDFVAVFTRGEYEDATAGNSTWADGDWNGDNDFNSSDFVTAFTAGGYELGPRQSVAAVPEPVGLTGFVLALTAAFAVRRRSFQR